MAEVYRSGAFLQQCWSVHPLCVAVRRITTDNQLALACTSCRFAHYVRLGSLIRDHSGGSVKTAAPEESLKAQSDVQARLSSCLETHAAALSLREMDVFAELLVIRCAECRRHYAWAVTGFETHQK